MSVSRRSQSEYLRCFPFIKRDANEFHDYCRISIDTFNYILSKISDQLMRNWTTFHKEPILPEEQLLNDKDFEYWCHLPRH
ncbi:hypothetical protein TKK_0015624 [Trichogramma kaykai]